MQRFNKLFIICSKITKTQKEITEVIRECDRASGKKLMNLCKDLEEIQTGVLDYIELIQKGEKNVR